MKPIRFLDTTLRDGQQSLWATRMTTDMMTPFFADIAASGVLGLDLMGLVQFDVAVRYLNEDPWERIRVARRLAGPSARLSGGIRSRSLTGFSVVPDDVLDLWVRNYISNGVDRISAFDPLFVVDNISDTLATATSLGVDAVGIVCFTVSPVHTDQFFVDHVVALHAASPLSSIMLKDPSGLLTPERVRTLVPALVQAVPEVPVEIHSHCMTGLAPYVYLAAVESGVSVVQTAIAPLSDGSSQPDSVEVAQNLVQMGFDVELDIDRTRAISERLQRVATARRKPRGTRQAYEVRHFGHQLPGGMITNLQAQLATRGMADRFDEVLDECARIREELAWPIMVTPFAQLVVTQAVLNVNSNERYAVVPDELKMYCLGNYGPPVAPIAPDILDRVVENGSGRVIPGPLRPPPALPQLRKDHPRAGVDELLLRFAFPGDLVDALPGTAWSDGSAASPRGFAVEPIANAIRHLTVAGQSHG